METLQKDLIKKLGKDNYHKVQKIQIGLAGAGGLGSNCALNLVRVGFKKLTIVDFDVIEASNLDRQFYFLDQVGMDKVEALKNNLLRINPGLEIKLVKSKIEKENVKGLFNHCHIVVECLDRAEHKSMLVQELLFHKKMVISASGLGGIGLSDNIKEHRIRENLILVGDLESDISQKPALSPRVNVAAAKQADIILDYVIKRRN